MKRLLLFSGVLVIVCCACSGTRHLSAEKFQQQAAYVGAIESFQHTTFKGTNGDRVYLEYWRAPIFFGKGVHRTYWTRTADLPPDIQKQLREGKNPWARPINLEPSSNYPGATLSYQVSNNASRLELGTRSSGVTNRLTP